MKIIGITGATGFVGQNLTEYLNGKFEYTAISREELTDTRKLDIARTGTIVHLAGKAHDLKGGDTDSYVKANYDLTKNLYDRFLESDCEKFIFVSSVKAVADTTEDVLFEDAVPSPHTAYGKSKLMAENYIRNQPLRAGKAYYILRPCMIHGPGNKGNLNLLYKVASKGIPYPLAAFENKRSFLSVENLCFVITELVERNDIPSGLYHVADNEALSTNQLVKLIGNSLGIKPKFWKIRPDWIILIAKLGDLFKLPLNTERLKKLTENYIVDNSKIINALGKPLPVNAVDGLRKTIQSFIAKHN